MRRLILLRHAKAEASEPGISDRARVLIERGRKDAAKIGAYLASHGFLPDRVALSPAARTQETWKCVSAALRPAPVAVAAPALYDAPPNAIFDVIKATPDAVRTLLVVAHNPGLHEVALLLIASGDIEARGRLRERLPTAGLIIIDFAFDAWSALHAQSGRLERFVSPKWLEAATR
jgi:phosphohistidine phosphatase